MKIAIIIPARMKSTRLPNKPMAEIKGKPMILQVLDRAQESKLGDVYIACSEKEVYNLVTSANANAIMTNPELPSGTDRVAAALKEIETNEKYGRKKYDIIVNLQGDLPTIPANTIQSVINPFLNQDYYDKIDVSTLVVNITNKSQTEITNPNSVKAAISFDQESENKKVGRALYFSRTAITSSDGNIYQHIGIYAYKTPALKKFVSIQPSAMEKHEKLEQLRGIENNMRFFASIVNWEPFEVNTKEDLEKVNQ